MPWCFRRLRPLHPASKEACREASTAAAPRSTGAWATSSAVSGGAGITSTKHELGRGGPTSFVLGYETEDIPDLIEVYYEGRLIHSTGYIGDDINEGTGSAVVKVPAGGASSVLVRVTGPDHSVGLHRSLPRRLIPVRIRAKEIVPRSAISAERGMHSSAQNFRQRDIFPENVLGEERGDHLVPDLGVLRLEHPVILVREVQEAMVCFPVVVGGQA